MPLRGLHSYVRSFHWILFNGKGTVIAMSALISTLATMAGLDDETISPEPVNRLVPDDGEDEQWSSLVHRIRQGEKDAVEELYRFFYGGIRLFLCRHLGPQELEDKVHDTFVIVLSAIRRGEVRDHA